MCKFVCLCVLETAFCIKTKFHFEERGWMEAMSHCDESNFKIKKKKAEQTNI